MKKTLIIIIILQLLILFVLVKPKGDINNDGEVNLIDLVQLRHILIEKGE